MTYLTRNPQTLKERGAVVKDDQAVTPTFLMASDRDRRYAFATLITRASYLAGVVVLAHTLRKHGSRYPLIVLYTPSLSSNAVRALQLEAAANSNMVMRPCDALLPPSHTKINLIAERFEDTWTNWRLQLNLPLL